jgi:Icc-related predicted phosphoesterase
MRIFFATDVHGSERCWRKFVNAADYYKADALVLGGDMTGKALFLIIQEKDGTYVANYLENKIVVKSKQELEDLQKQITNRGYYPYVIPKEELQELRTDEKKLETWVDKTFRQQIAERIQHWDEIAEDKFKGTNRKCYVCPGNDDMFEIDDIIKKSSYIQDTEGELIELDGGIAMISSGWSNRTPWKTFRERDEEELSTYFTALASQVKDFSKCVFNCHVPPYNTGLDSAAELDDNLQPKYAAKSTVPVGSTAVRAMIERYQPVLGLHGHIHECKAVRKIGKTLCVNPGSSYEQGILLGAIVDLDDGGVKRYFLNSG